MFKELAALVGKTGALTLMITGDETALTVTVLPKPSLAKEFPALGSGVAVTDQPETLDETFVRALSAFTPQYTDAFDQIAAFKKAADQALTDAREKSKKDVASASKSSKYVPPAKKTSVPVATTPSLLDISDDDDEAASNNQRDAPEQNKGTVPPLPPLPAPSADVSPALF